MKRIASLFVLIILVFTLETHIYAENAFYTEAENEYDVAKNAKSAVLMDADTGEVLYKKNEASALPPASVTKIMTLLLSVEALDCGVFEKDDKVRISSYAASMGGSQVYLEEGEYMTVDELIKCTAIASANDAAVALAELVSGSEEAFVKKMNAKAMELGLSSTNFENVTGLDDTVVNHVTSAMDIALMSRELLKYDIITSYTSLWQDSIRDGEFTLTNTNRLVRYYDGCNGLKTGSTDKAGFCMSATAKRGDLQRIAVVMGADTRDKRNETARELLDFGFANYALYTSPEERLESVKVYFGEKNSVDLYSSEFKMLLNKSDAKRVEKVYEIPENITAPVKSGEVVGKVEYMLDGKSIGSSPIYVKDEVEKISFLKLYLALISSIFGSKL